MLNRRFGKCVVLSRADRIHVTATATIDAWNCICDCGNKFVARGPQLRFGKIVSCGCAAESKWEMWLSQYLDKHGYDYEPHKFYSDLRGLGNGYLTYDFCIHMGKFDVLIECQGLQHYQPVDYFGGISKFNVQLEHDRLKREYAKKHDIKLITIDCSKNISFDKYLAKLDDIFMHISL
jgi:hypothetical protein